MSIDKINSAAVLASLVNNSSNKKKEAKQDYFGAGLTGFYSKLSEQRGTSKELTNAVKQSFNNLDLIVLEEATNIKKS